MWQSNPQLSCFILPRYDGFSDEFALCSIRHIAGKAVLTHSISILSLSLCLILNALRFVWLVNGGNQHRYQREDDDEIIIIPQVVIEPTTCGAYSRTPGPCATTGLNHDYYKYYCVFHFICIGEWLIITVNDLSGRKISHD